ncbi:hypothetical protein NUACC26_029410 [Scytonema sp. NUACC26]
MYIVYLDDVKIDFYMSMGMNESILCSWSYGLHTSLFKVLSRGFDPPYPPLKRGEI